MNSQRTGAMVFGATDGLTLILGLVLGMAVSHQPGMAVWHSALSGGVAELGGMSLGQYWSDPTRDKLAAASNGLAGGFTVIASGLPFAFESGAYAVVMSVITVMLFAVAITWMRSENGWTATLRTFGLLLLAAALSVGANFM